MLSKLQFGLVITLVTLLAAACQAGTRAEAGDLAQREINVVTTIGMITDIVENVGGERVRVKGLMGPGVDPHLYKASEGDVIRLGSADLVFYSGLHLEAQMGRVLERMADTGVRTAAVTDDIERDLLLTPPEFEDNYDPHVWFDVTLWRKSVEQVRDTLIDLDPEHAALYQSNAESYLRELDKLHAYVQAQAERVPADQRVLTELEGVHRALISMHLEKTLKSDRVIRELRR